MLRNEVVAQWKREYDNVRVYSISRDYYCINVLSLNYYVLYNDKDCRMSFSKSYYTLNDIRKIVAKKLF